MTTDRKLCCLSHPGFHRLDDLHFRLSESDKLPAMAFKLDGSYAVLLIPAVQVLFEIEAGHSDATTLNMIGSALRFVTRIKLGDPFPTEITTGVASWQPAQHHRSAALSSLQLKLLRWISADQEAGAVTPEMLLAGDSNAKRIVNNAFQKAASELSIQGGATAVALLVDDLAEELAYIEALRERLLHRVKLTLHVLVQYERGTKGLPAERRETIRQVARLMSVGIREISSLFEVVDSQTADITLVLRDLEGQRSVMMPNRNWLYCICIAWEEELRAWRGLPGGVPGERDWHLVESLYRFVAARFMKADEWRKFDAANLRKTKQTMMVW